MRAIVIVLISFLSFAVLATPSYATAKHVSVDESIPAAPISEGKVIYVNIARQRLFAYENGTSFFQYAVPITSGKRNYETVRGTFEIYKKQEGKRFVSTKPGDRYDYKSKYWMPFFQGYGFHDAPWRRVFGTQSYTSVGSHGCINMRLSEVIWLYNWAEVGTKVVIE